MKGPILIAIVILLVGCIETSDDGGPITPKGRMSTRGAHNYDIYVINVTPPSDMNDTYCELLNGSVVVFSLNLSDIRYVPLRNESDGSILSQITWMDATDDWQFSTGDAILLMDIEPDDWNGTEAEPGLAGPGMVFRIRYKPTNGIIAEITLT